jgi:signal transduction histidine kinase
MLKRFRHLPISLAAKCQILFGVALVLIIGVALYFPWKRMEGLIQDDNLQTAEGVARQTWMEHAARQHLGLADPTIVPPAPLRAATTGNSEASAQADYVWPRLYPVNPPRSLRLGQFETKALNRFLANPSEYHYPLSYTFRGAPRYRLAMPLYNEQSCLSCHGGEGTPIAAALIPATAPSAGVAPAKLLGIVVVDIPSQVTESQLFLNRMVILLAGLIAGILAIGVFYLIVTQLILQPVRVLQETAEKVSEGDLNIRSDISTGDEFQQLSETFNTMLTNLKSSDDQLRSINKALDIKLGQLAQSNVALYESNRLKSEFLANVSHELRTPLNSILGFAELLRDTVSQNPDAKPVRYLQNILIAGQNLLDLINDLLDLAKIEAGRMDVRSEPLSLGDVFEGLINLLKPLAEAKNLSIVPTVGPDVPIIHSDPAKLQQVLYNFLSNAIKFSPTGGRVDIAAEMQPGDAVRIMVIDQGPGIDPQKHDLIFEKFRQIDGSVTREHSGTGLGLSISKELTVLLGGTIGVKSAIGQGAAFWIILPLATQPGQRDVREKIVTSS